MFTEHGPNRIGHAYWKSLYRAYTDATFTHRIADTDLVPGHGVASVTTRSACSDR